MNTLKNNNLPQLTISELRKLSGMTQVEFATYLKIPIGTVKNWENSNKDSKRECKPYMIDLIQDKLIKDYYINEYIIDMFKKNKFSDRLGKYHELMTDSTDGNNTEEINLKLKQISNIVDQLSMDDIARAIRNTHNEKDKALYKVLGNYLFMNSRTTINTIRNIKK